MSQIYESMNYPSFFIDNLSIDSCIIKIKEMISVNEFDECIDYISKLPKDYHKNMRILADYACCFYFKGMISNANVLFDIILENFCEYTKIYFFKALCLLELNDPTWLNFMKKSFDTKEKTEYDKIRNIIFCGKLFQLASMETNNKLKKQYLKYSLSLEYSESHQKELADIYFIEYKHSKCLNNYFAVIQNGYNDPLIHSRIALILHSRGCFSQSISYFRNGLELANDDKSKSIIISNMCKTYISKNKTFDCLELIKKYPDITPDLCKLEIYNDIGDFIKVEELFKKLKCVPSCDLLFLNYTMLDNDLIFEIHKNSVSNKPPPKYNFNYNNNKIQLGFVSGDFYNHVVATFLIGLFKNIDRSKFNVICFSNTEINDWCTKELQMLVDVWINIYSIDAHIVCKIITDKKIDILFDLSGHTKNDRLDIFALKPAPITISYLGYPNTTGLDCMDYKLTDKICDPPENHQKYSEKLLYLPHCMLNHYQFFSYDTNKSPFEKNNGIITFGCFNRFHKISKTCIIMWSIIMNKIPNSKLILKSKEFQNPEYCKQLLDLFEKNQINPNRIEIYKYSTQINFLKYYWLIDISFDTHPYSGTTTTCDSLYMSTPVITLTGNRHSSNVSASILINSGLPEFVTNNKSDYIKTCINLASNTEKLKNYHNTIRQKFLNSYICNHTQFSKDFENTILSTL